MRAKTADPVCTRSSHRNDEDGYRGGAENRRVSLISPPMEQRRQAAQPSGRQPARSSVAAAAFEVFLASEVHPLEVRMSPLTVVRGDGRGSDLSVHCRTALIRFWTRRSPKVFFKTRCWARMTAEAGRRLTVSSPAALMQVGLRALFLRDVTCHRNLCGVQPSRTLVMPPCSEPTGLLQPV